MLGVAKSMLPEKVSISALDVKDGGFKSDCIDTHCYLYDLPSHFPEIHHYYLDKSARISFTYLPEPWTFIYT